MFVSCFNSTIFFYLFYKIKTFLFDEYLFLKQTWQTMFTLTSIEKMDIL